MPPRFLEVLAISRREDEHAAAVVRFLQARGHTVGRFSLNDLRSTPFRWSPNEALRLETSAGPVTVGPGTTIWWRRTGWVETNDLCKDEAELIRAEGLELLTGALLTSQAEWVDRPESLLLAENKLYQLAVAQGLGIQTPDSLVTNDTRAAKAFAVRGPVLAKAVSSGSGLAPFADVVTPEDLQLVKAAPTLLQRSLLADADLRVVTVNEDAFVWSRRRDTGAPIDWRQADPSGEKFIRQTRPELEQAAIQISQALNLTMSIQDWLDTEDGLTFLEVNPQGQWLFLPGARNELVAAVAKHLVRDKQPRSGYWPPPIKQFLWNLGPASRAPSASGVKPPVMAVPPWITVAQCVEAEIVLHARRAHDQADSRARIAEEKGSRLVNTNLVLLATTLGFIGYQLGNNVLSGGLDLDLLSFLLLILSLFFFAWSALNAFAIDDVGPYVHEGAEIPTKAPNPKRELLRLEEEARATANWTARNKLDILLDARAHFSRGVVAVVLASLLWLLAIVS